MSAINPVQKNLDEAAFAKKWLEQFPFLEAAALDAPKYNSNGLTLAARNIRRLLKKNYPDVRFSVQCERYSGGSSIYVKWDDWSHWEEKMGLPVHEVPVKDVEDMLTLFDMSSGAPISMDDSYNYDHDVERCTFRHLFGSTKYLHCYGRQPSPEEMVMREAEWLSKVASALPSSPKTKTPKKRL